jgi:hypothetical protein
MPITQISLNGNPVSLVALPSSPGFRSLELSFSNAVAVVTSMFTGQSQVQRWPGADAWSGTLTLPQMTQLQADAWIAALMQCQGMTNAVQIGDPMKTAPRGSALGSPKVNGIVPMAAGGSTLYTYGWNVSKNGQLLPGDYLQVGYRLHRVLDQVNSDVDGKAPISIWPSLREIPAADQPLILQSPKGLFRLATNKGTWSTDFTRLTSISFQITEHR